MVEGLRCLRCGYIWVPRVDMDKVKICPKCKSPYWDVPRKEKKGVVVEHPTGGKR